MKDKNRLGKEYLLTSNFASTLNGGSAFASVELFRESDHYRLEVFVPGVEDDDYALEVKDSHLLVYHWMHIFLDENHFDTSRIPRIVRALSIPLDVDVKNIYAEVTDGVLFVFMPFNEFAQGYHQDINIHKEDHD
jgi:HSP20 family molecular chaperone IbpA